MRDYILSSRSLSKEQAEHLANDTLRFVIRTLSAKQSQFRDNFLQDLEGCCAAANDFFRMMELVEVEIDQPFQEEAADLLALYSADAVYSARLSTVFVFAPIHDTIRRDLFGDEWENNLTQNEVALSLVRTIDDFWTDIRAYLGNDYLAKKVADSLVSKTVVFYVKCLLEKAGQSRRRQNTAGRFLDPRRAARRIHGDIRVMKKFFKGMAADGMPALSRVIEREFSPLVAIHECLSIVTGTSKANISDFIFVLHKITLDYKVTQQILCDLWRLAAPGDERKAWIIVSSMRESLVEISGMKDAAGIPARSDRNHNVPATRLDELLLRHYGSPQQRRRRVKAKLASASRGTAADHRERCQQKLAAVNLKAALEVLSFPTHGSENSEQTTFMKKARARLHTSACCACWRDCTV